MKRNYDILFENDIGPELKENEPYTFMRSSVILSENGFSIWKQNRRNQNIHTHDYYQMWYVFTGSCEHTIDNHKFCLKSGDIIIIPPYAYHSMHAGSDDLLVIGIDFTDEFMSENSSSDRIMLSCINPLIVKQKSNVSVFFGDDEIEGLILEMFSEHMKKNDFYEIVIKSNLMKLLVMIERMSIAESSDDNHRYLIGEVVRYIHNNLNSKIKLSDLCNLTNISESLLASAFKKITGQTIIEYVNTLKINKAKQLLKETNMSVTSISYDLGFSDGAYFNRVFKANAGCSPKEYRKHYKE
ncbi:MAG: helix-turn-helix transcriptional regulator [Clostridia bacterium]|nr:helix-turn-helix transcriptional regulator [Clostridia bacterium]